ncbi:MAG: c-type cytochrome, partial [Flavisolibacter sp.]
MNILQIHAKRRILTGLFFFFLMSSGIAQTGQQLFQNNCASCHGLDKALSGPALRGVTTRGPWAEDRANLYAWIKNPAAFIPTTQYTIDLQKQYGSIMPSFPQFSQEQVDAILEYIETPPAAPTGGGGGTVAETDNNRGALIFGIISLILALVALILMQVNSNLKKLSDDKEQIMRP